MSLDSRDEAESTYADGSLAAIRGARISDLPLARSGGVCKGLHTSWESQRPDLRFDSGSYAHQLIVSGRRSAARVHE